MPAVVNYQRIHDGASLSGKYGESLVGTERWQIRVDSPAISKLQILTEIAAAGGIRWGSAHPDIPALKAMEFDLQPEGKEGMRWTLSVRYYIPPPGKVPKDDGTPKDRWDRSGGSTTVPAFTDVSGVTITNAAGDPLEGLEEEQEESAWTLTKHYVTDVGLESDIVAYAGRVNSATWAGYGEKRWKCYFKGAEKITTNALDGSTDGATLSWIKATWEFRLRVDTWKCMPWDVGFMELVSGSRKAILDSAGKAVKQPVALNSNGTKRSDGSKPLVINSGNGVDLYLTANFTSGFGTPKILS
jgi:hypothetical protein